MNFKKREMRRLLLLFLVITISGVTQLFADEGLWLPTVLKKYKIEDIQKAGFKLTAEDIYDINKACLKDAIVGLSRGSQEFSFFCSGGIISDKGLLITNHHCGLSYVQSLSSLEHNYLKDGYWAKDMSQELYCKELNASVLVKIVDVTEELLKATENLNPGEKRNLMNKRGEKIVKRETDGNGYKGRIQSFFGGNQYFLSVYKVFKDVRLVGVPPETIGKFGKDTDNWIWPRHTGDFCVFRIYSDTENNPAVFAQNNKPYKPVDYLKISTKELKENDFTMVLGYPGSTKQYITSHAVEQMKEELPIKIKIRTARLDIMNAAMDACPAVKLKYTAKAASVANAWKKWQGELEGIEKYDIVGKKQEFEKKFVEWINSDKKLKSEYGMILPVMKQFYQKYKELDVASTLFDEVTYNGVEIIRFSAMFDRLVSISMRKKATQKDIDKEIKRLRVEIDKFYPEWDYEVDRKIYASLLKLWQDNLTEQYYPEELKHVLKKYKGDYDAYSVNAFKKSMFSNKEKVSKFLDSYTKDKYKKVEKDPVFRMSIDMFMLNVQKIYNNKSKLRSQVAPFHTLYIKAIKDMGDDKNCYPDANATFRVSYGNIKGYMEKDGVYHTCTTSFDGLIEKSKIGNHDYKIPEKLLDIYNKKDYGRYAVNGSVPVCFIANNHTTGGNSGSPVLNAEGQLIGINFDRAWKGVFSDFYYTPEICRNISLDIRFVLFLIDKYAGAQNIIDELTLINK